MAEERGAPLDTLTVADLQSLHPSFESDVSAVWSYENRYFFPYHRSDGIGLILRYGYCVYNAALKAGTLSAALRRPASSSRSG
jgi:hypothetical protein